MPLSSVVAMVAEQLARRRRSPTCRPVDAPRAGGRRRTSRGSRSRSGDAVPARARSRRGARTAADRRAAGDDGDRPRRSRAPDLPGEDRRRCCRTTGGRCSCPTAASSAPTATDAPPFTTSDLLVRRGADHVHPDPWHPADRAGAARHRVGHAHLPEPAAGHRDRRSSATSSGSGRSGSSVSPPRCSSTSPTTTPTPTPPLDRGGRGRARPTTPGRPRPGMRSIEPIALSAASPDHRAARRAPHPSAHLPGRRRAHRAGHPDERRPDRDRSTCRSPSTPRLDGPVEQPAERFTVEREPAP